jgi:uncharacterized membrane protein YfcA
LITFILYIIHSIAGVTLIFFPSLFGGITKSKKYYKHHRLIGYIILALIWLSAITATRANWTRRNFNHPWIWIISIGMIITGTIGRINLNKIKICNKKWNFFSSPNLIQYIQYIPIYSQNNQTNQTDR